MYKILFAILLLFNLLVIFFASRMLINIEDISEIAYKIVREEVNNMLFENSFSRKSIQVLADNKLSKVDLNKDNVISKDEVNSEIDNLFLLIDGNKDEKIQIIELKQNKRKVVDWFLN